MNFPLTVSLDNEAHHFEVSEHPHHSGNGCKFRVFEAGIFVAALEPGQHDFLQICQNPGKIEQEVLHLLAEQIEAHYPHGVNDNVIKIRT